MLSGFLLFIACTSLHPSPHPAEVASAQELTPLASTQPSLGAPSPPSSTSSSPTSFVPPSCSDECVVGQANGAGEACELFDVSTSQWVGTGAPHTSLRDRARWMESWIEADMRPAGGLCQITRYEDEQLNEVSAYLGMWDAAIWSGSYLAARALQTLTTQSPESEDQMNRLVYTLHDWFNVSGDPGYLARFAAPTSSDELVNDIFELNQPYFETTYKGEPWRYLGDISRDQYQGVLLGYSLAYQATSSEEVRSVIRDDVVEFVEELMKVRQVRLHINTTDGLSVVQNLQLQYVVLTTAETASGQPTFLLDLDNIDDSDLAGFQEFHPLFINVVTEQIPLLSWVPEIPRSGSAVMLASFFQVALQVTEGIPEYAARRQVIADHYEMNFDQWWDIAEAPLGFDFTPCGDKYYSNNIRHMPMYNLARLDKDPVRSERIGLVLQEQLWSPVKDHKNTLFAYIYAANHPDPTSIQSIIDSHTDQLATFRSAPLQRNPVDLTDIYPEDPKCPGNALSAIDVGQREDDGFLWQRNPWELVNAGQPNAATSGVDFLLAYWMGRFHGFIEEDSVDQCLQWREPTL